MDEPERDLFGQRLDRFESALSRYGVWPMTVWPVDLSDPETRALKEAIGDVGSGRLVKRQPFPGENRQTGGAAWQTRHGAFTKAADDESVYRGKVTASIFNPAVAAWILNLYAPTAGTVFDPFAGGGTRAIMASKRGLKYVGTELRADECAAVRARLEAAGITEGATIIHADARNAEGVASASAQFCYTCPPYWTLEQYEGGPGDLSMMQSYDDFVAALGEVVDETRRILSSGALSVWVVGLHRHEDGRLVAMNHDVARLHTAEGHFKFREEIVLWQKNNGSIQRVGNFEKGEGRLVRVHEYAMVFEKAW